MLGNDGGAVVSLYLPVSARPELALDDLAAGTAATGQRVWLLDDQEQVLEFSRVSLEAQGYRVEPFGDVASLVGAARTDAPRPDGLVLGRVLPDGGGAGALRLLRAAGVAAPVLWVSGHVPDGEELPPGDAFLQKPYTGRELAGAVWQLLRGADR